MGGKRRSSLEGLDEGEYLAVDIWNSYSDVCELVQGLSFSAYSTVCLTKHQQI